jgi:L-2-hydroxyglutarate oxidase LhgO
VRVVTAGELQELEPNVRGVAGLHSPTTAIVDFCEVTRRLMARAQQHGATLRTSFEVTSLEIVASRGFRSFIRKNWAAGVREMVGSVSKRVFIAAARRYVPELTVGDVLPGPSGIRAQAMDPDGSLFDDFRISRRGPVVAVRNALTPAATSSLAIAEHIIDIALERRVS